MNRFSSLVARIATVAAVVTVLLALPASRAAAQDKIYALNEVTTQPRLASPSVALRTIQASYPSDLRSRGISGEVEIEFVVNTTGKVESGSIAVVDATVPQLGEAAKSAVKDLDFTPAKVGANAVRSKVVLPIAYRP